MNWKPRRSARLTRSLPMILLTAIALCALIPLSSSALKGGAFAAGTAVARATPSTARATAKATKKPSTTPTKKPAVRSASTPAVGASASGTLSSSKKLTGVRICLDPGHQNKADRAPEDLAPWSNEQKPRTSSGTQGVSTKTAEYVYTLEFSNKLAEALRARGASVKLTRTSHDVKLSNIERAEIGNEFNADVVLRIHCDGAENSKKNGIGMFVGKTASSAAKSKEYAAALLQSMLRTTGAKNGGVHASDTYTGLNWSKVPSILVELGYMSNPDEDRRLATDAYQQKLIDGIIGWCLDEFGK